VVVLRGVIDVNAAPPEAIQFQVIAMFLIGCMLYLAIIPLIFYRLTFVPMRREDFSPPYWINMGAVAITALAGSILILRGETWPLLGPLLPFIRGFTFFFWAVASWWIPFLFALMIWRYLWMRDRFTYEPAVWGMVFPLGMYATSTYQFDRAMGYGFLDPVPEVLGLCRSGCMDAGDGGTTASVDEYAQVVIGSSIRPAAILLSTSAASSGSKSVP